MPDDDDGRFEELWRYYDSIVLFFKRLRFDDADARDLAQEVYVRVLRSMDTYRGEAKWNFLQQVARRIAINVFRDRAAQKRSAVLVPEESLLGITDTSVVPPDVELENVQTGQRLGHAIDQLPPDQKICVLHSAQGFSYREISQIVGITENAVKSRLREARKRLREQLGDELEGLGDDS